MISHAPTVFPGGGNLQTAQSLLAHHGLISLQPLLFLFAFPRVCVCNNSLKPYRGEISGRRYGATAPDIIARLHASLLSSRLFVRMAAGELNKRATA